MPIPERDVWVEWIQISRERVGWHGVGTECGTGCTVQEAKDHFFHILLAVCLRFAVLIDLLTMKVMCPQVLVVLLLGLMAAVGGSRVDGGGKPAACKSTGPREVPALPEKILSR